MKAKVAHSRRLHRLLVVVHVVVPGEVERLGAARAAEHLAARAAVVLEPRERPWKLPLAPVARLDHPLVHPELRPVTQEMVTGPAFEPRRGVAKVGARA